MISCDFCPLHWHVDCLDPPLSTYPPFSRKWRCPNHASMDDVSTHIGPFFATELRLPKRRRVPKASGAPVDIADTNQFNNGNIEITVPEDSSHSTETLSVDEVLINGRKYRVPERIVILDFWNKLRHDGTSDSRCVHSSVDMDIVLKGY